MKTKPDAGGGLIYSGFLISSDGISRAFSWHLRNISKRREEEDRKFFFPLFIFCQCSLTVEDENGCFLLSSSSIHRSKQQLVFFASSSSSHVVGSLRGRGERRRKGEGIHQHPSSLTRWLDTQIAVNAAEQPTEAACHFTHFRVFPKRKVLAIQKKVIASKKLSNPRAFERNFAAARKFFQRKEEEGAFLSLSPIPACSRNPRRKGHFSSQEMKMRGNFYFFFSFSGKKPFSLLMSVDGNDRLFQKFCFAQKSEE